MPVFGQGDQKKFSMNPQVGKSLYGSSTGSAAPAGDGESPADEAAEPATITCPDCGAKIELTAGKPVEESDDTNGDLPAGSDEEFGE